MVAITVRNVDREVRDRLAERARGAGQSLEEFLRRQLEEISRKKSTDEWLAEVQEHVSKHGVEMTSEQIVTPIREFRDTGRG